MRILFFMLTTCVLLTGCSTTMPQRVAYPPSTQLEMQSAQHWDILSADVAYQIYTQLIKKNLLDVPVYVKYTCGSDSNTCKTNETAPFNEGFRDLLISSLVAFNVTTVAQPTEDSITVDYKSQVVFHAGKNMMPTKPGMLTALTAGIMVFRNVTTDFLTLAAASAIDVFHAQHYSPEIYEVIITTSIVNEQKYLFRQSDIYYINDVNFWHYLDNQGGAQEIQLTNSSFNRTSVQAAQSSTVGKQNILQPLPLPDEPKDMTVVEPKKLSPDKGTDI